MPSLEILPTVYRDRRFRTRIEARWAVFFDSLPIAWHYEMQDYPVEPEGFAVARYLCDYWLPLHKVWFESKGNAAFTREEMAKCAALCAYTKFPVWGMWGSIPEADPSLGLGARGGVSWTWVNDRVVCDEAVRWCHCPHCGRVGVSYQGRPDKLCGCRFPNSDLPHDVTPQLRWAYGRAHGARFEHEEWGGPAVLPFPGRST